VGGLAGIFRKEDQSGNSLAAASSQTAASSGAGVGGQRSVRHFGLAASVLSSLARNSDNESFGGRWFDGSKLVAW